MAKQETGGRSDQLFQIVTDEGGVRLSQRQLEEQAASVIRGHQAEEAAREAGPEIVRGLGQAIRAEANQAVQGIKDMATGIRDVRTQQVAESAEAAFGRTD